MTLPPHTLERAACLIVIAAGRPIAALSPLRADAPLTPYELWRARTRAERRRKHIPDRLAPLTAAAIDFHLNPDTDLSLINHTVPPRSIQEEAADYLAAAAYAAIWAAVVLIPAGIIIAAAWLLLAVFRLIHRALG